MHLGGRPWRGWGSAFALSAATSTALLLSQVAVVGPSQAVGVTTSPPAAGTLAAGGLVVTASSMDLGGLVFEGVVTVPTTAGDRQVVKLVSASAALTDLRLEVPCTAVPGLGRGITSEIFVPTGATSTAGSGLTLYATSVTATTGGATLTWTPAAPPPANQLGSPTLTDVTIQALGLQAPALDLPRTRQTASFCAP